MGRARQARPTLCLLGLALVLGAFASQARGALPDLEVTQTNPVSVSAEAPANSTTPLVIGHEDGGITTAIHDPRRLGLPVAAAVDPSEEVVVYADPACADAPIGTGTLNEFEGTGIQVEVPADSLTKLYVRHFDSTEALEPSACPKNGFPYWESSTVVAPPPGELPVEQPPAEQRPVTGNPPFPPRLHTQPGGRANNNTPRILGSAPGAERVKVFANSSCSGAPILNLSSAELAFGAAVHVADNSVTDFAGISVANGKQSFCSPPATYMEDSSPPRTRITMGPGVKTRRHKAVFRFADTGEEPLATSFQCRVNRKKWKPCHSPFKLRHLRFHRYTLRVRGTDQIGNAESKPAKRSFKVIR